MSETNAPAIDAADSSVSANVDAALGRWRVETERRRSVWASKNAEFVADQKRRRERLTAFVGTASFSFAATMGVAALVWSQWSVEVVPASAPAIAAVSSEAPSSFDHGAALEPVRRVDAPTNALGVAGPVVSWQQAGTMWIQVDLTTPDGAVRWLDARGEEVLERNLCDNALTGGRFRCFVGRTPLRVSQAIDAGAAPGTWTAEVCHGDACTPVASYQVSQADVAPTKDLLPAD